nr:hypothetical protein [Micromonospora sp. DSM 115978]
MGDTSQTNHAGGEREAPRGEVSDDPAGWTNEDSDAAEIMRRTLDNWPSYTPGDDQ